jgi:hypothetical protein
MLGQLLLLLLLLVSLQVLLLLIVLLPSMTEIFVSVVSCFRVRLLWQAMLLLLWECCCCCCPQPGAGKPYGSITTTTLT